MAGLKASNIKNTLEAIESLGFDGAVALFCGRALEDSSTDWDLMMLDWSVECLQRAREASRSKAKPTKEAAAALQNTLLLHRFFREVAHRVYRARLKQGRKPNGRFMQLAG